jgi:hypothetical protein
LKECFRQNQKLLEVYLEHLSQNGYRLPEHPQREGELYFEQIQAEAELSTFALVLTSHSKNGPNIKLRKILEEAKAKLGLEVRVIPLPINNQSSPQITYKELLEKGSEWRKGELQGSSSAQQLYNTRYALRRFCRSLNLKEEDLIEEAMGSNFAMTIELLAPSFESDDTFKKFKSEMGRWKEYRHRLTDGSYPDSFQDTFVKVVDNSRLPLTVINTHIGATVPRLQSWYRGEAEPYPVSHRPLLKMERLFRLPPDTLVGRIPNWNPARRFRTSELPAVLQENKNLRRKVVRFLPPDFIEKTAEEQQKIIDSILDSRYNPSDEHGKKSKELRGLPYKLNDWPSPIDSEVKDLVDFMTSMTVPIGMRRAGRWRQTAAEKFKSHLASIFGSLRLPVDAEDERLRGLGIDESALTLAMIACPKLMHWYFKFYFEVRNQYTNLSTELLNSFMSLLVRRKGWLRQRPQLASRLTPVSYDSQELITHDLIARALVDWDGVCDEAISEYEDLYDDVKGIVKRARNPIHPIRGIIGLENPFTALGLMISGIKSKMPKVTVSPYYYHLAVRDMVIVFTFWLTGLRRHTVELMDYFEDGSGHVRFAVDCYVMDVPPELFKVENSSFFGPKYDKSNYYSELPDAVGLNEVFAEYLSVSRTWLISKYYPDAKESPFIVNGPGGIGVRMQGKAISNTYRTLTSRYLVKDPWSENGIEGTRPHGPHSTRYIRGTVVRRITGSLEQAGNANQHTAQTAKLYSVESPPKEKTQSVNQHISALLSEISTRL